jgi:hypothetical protein
MVLVSWLVVLFLALCAIVKETTGCCCWQQPAVSSSGSSSSQKASGIIPSVVVRRLTSVDEFDAAAFYKEGAPLLIANVLSAQELEECTDYLMSRHSSRMVELQHQLDNRDPRTGRGKAVTNMYEVTLQKATEAIFWASQSDSAYLTFCEGLLLGEDDDDSDERQRRIRQLTTNARERLFKDDPDWFAKYFPKQYQPTDAVILAGIGATSTLHRDPFEWLGTNLCLEGSKVWRMVHPGGNVHAIDRALDAYRLESIAWDVGDDDDNNNGITSTTRSLSAGWQSNKSLFRHRQHDKLPRIKDLLEIMQATDDDDEVQQQEKKYEKMRYLTAMAHDTDRIAPDDSIPDDTVTYTTFVQQEGDLLLIPAPWWHQTLALEPSVAIASQRCGRAEAPHVLKHMLDWNDKSSTDIDRLLQQTTATPQAVVDLVLRRIFQD